MPAPHDPGPALLGFVRAGVLAWRRGDTTTLPPPLARPYDRARGCVVTLVDNAGVVRAVASRWERPVANLALATLECAYEAARRAGQPPRWARVDVIHRVVPIVAPSALGGRAYGVIVRWGDRVGVQPPEMPGVEGLDAQIAAACARAGLPASAPVRMHRFTGEWFAGELFRAAQGAS